MKMTKIYDTSSLLVLSDDELFQSDVKTIITNITLKELENIKTSPYKDISVKYQARQLLQRLDSNPDKYTWIMYKPSFDKFLNKFCLEDNNDSKILLTAYYYYSEHPEEDVYFYTNDLSLKKIAETFFGSHVASIQFKDSYTGYTDLYLNDTEMADFYSYPYNWGEQLNINEYVNIYAVQTNQCVDTLCWTGEKFRPLKYKVFSSKQLGDIKPYKNDVYQAMAADSLMNNKITMLRGPSGSGKTHLALGYLFYLLDREKISKIIIFCNTVATKNSAKLGFYPGTRDEKLLDSQIGNLLASKLGSKIIVEQLINEEKLLLLPMSDIRGYDTSGMNAGIYISEAQNLDIPLLKLALQRAGEDCIFILDGDTKSQVDLVDYDGFNNGMRRASKVFRNHSIYGEVALKQIHRSEIASLADFM